MKQVVFKLDEEILKEGKVMAIRRDLSFKDFITELIKEEAMRVKEKEVK